MRRYSHAPLASASIAARAAVSARSRLPYSPGSAVRIPPGSPESLGGVSTSTATHMPESSWSASTQAFHASSTLMSTPFKRQTIPHRESHHV